MLPISVHIPHYASSTIIKTQNCLGELIQNTKQIRNFSISATPMLETLMLKSLVAYFAFQALGSLYGDRSEIFPNNFLQALLFSPKIYASLFFFDFPTRPPKTFLTSQNHIWFKTISYWTSTIQFVKIYKYFPTPTVCYHLLNKKTSLCSPPSNINNQFVHKALI